MQDIHSLGSRIFSGGIDRRLRTHNAMNHQQALKCPRCESLNTKFCYFNNYNLSQPRHFCKGCRRYWTKGGVLRNVPVGGGFRKAKRSSKSKQPPSSADADVPPPRKSNSNSSSESSSLTATTTTAATEVVSGGSSSNSCPTLFNFAPDAQVFVPQITNPSFSQPDLIDPSSDGTGSFFHEIGRFTEMMTSSTDLGFIIADMTTFGSENQSNDKVVEKEGLNQVQDMTSGGYLDQTVEIEFTETENRISNGGLAGVDWRNGVDDQDQGMFDLTGTVDEAYWSQTQWPDHTDHSSFHYLP